MFPIFRLLIPILFGMMMANYCFKLIEWNNPFIIIALIIFALTSFFSKNSLLKNITTYASVALFGFILCLHSIHSAEEKYGDDWQQSVYSDNPFHIESASRIQQSIVHWYRNHGVTNQPGAIIEAMTIGVKERLSKDTKLSFSQAGVSHILALSGFHVGLIYLLLHIVFLTRIVDLRWRWISQVLIITLLWIYAFIAGMSPSLVRAVLMCTLLAIGWVQTRQTLSLNALGLSALLTILLHPIIVMHVGFQMSYMCMLGIYFLGIPLVSLYEGYTFIDRFIWATISISISCTLMVLPIVSHTFGTISLATIPCNIIVTILAYALFFILPVWFMTIGSTIITRLLMSISSILLLFVSHIASQSLSSIRFSFPTWTVYLYYIILFSIIAYFKWKKNKKRGYSLHF